MVAPEEPGPSGSVRSSHFPVVTEVREWSADETGSPKGEPALRFGYGG